MHTSSPRNSMFRAMRVPLLSHFPVKCDHTWAEMDKSSSLAPFAFILLHSSPGSARSCSRPARKLHLKLALWSEWLISHLVGMKVNERSKETASSLLYIQPRRACPIYKNLPAACSRWLPEKVSESCIIVWSGKKKSKTEAVSIFLVQQCIQCNVSSAGNPSCHVCSF